MLLYLKAFKNVSSLGNFESDPSEEYMCNIIHNIMCIFTSHIIYYSRYNNIVHAKS